MKTIPELQAELKDLIDSSELSLSHTTDKDGQEYLRLMLNPSSLTELPEFVCPQYIAPVLDGKTPEYSMMARLLLKDLNLEALSSIGAVSEKVNSFLQSADELNRCFIPRSVDKFEAFSDTGHTFIKIYHLDIRQAIHQGIGDAASRFAMIPKTEGVEAFDKAGLYKLAGLISVPKSMDRKAALEFAFSQTQNIDEAWHLNESALSITPNQRSSMTGDVFIIGGKPSLVAMVGFKDFEKFGSYGQQDDSKKNRNPFQDEGPSL